MKRTMLLIIALLLLISFSPVLAELKTFVKEYTYQASENDSRNSSRTIAMREVKRLLLEELGTYLESVTEVQNFQLTKDQITTLTAGIVKTEIVNEKWDGSIYWLKAKILVDPGRVIKSIDSLRKDYQKTKELEEIRKRSEGMLRENERLRKELATAKGQEQQKEKIAYAETIKNLTAIEWFENGLIYVSQGQYDDALAAFTFGLNINPVNWGYFLRAMAYYAAHYYDNAIQDLSTAIVLNPNVASYYALRGNAYIFKENFEKAFQDAQKALLLNPNESSAYFVRGTVYAHNHQFDRAIDNLNKAISLDSNDNLAYIAYMKRGVIYHRLGKNYQAIEDFSKVINSNSAVKSGDVYIFRAFAYEDTGDLNNALGDCNRAINMNPNNAGYYFSRSTVYLKLGNRGMMMSDLEKACNLGDNQSCNLVDSYYRLYR